MKPITIGLIREGRVPPDKRVAFTPLQVVEIMQKFPNVKVVCQTSPVRCYKDEEYSHIPVVENLNECDIIMGIKEVPIPDLIPNKTYVFFSHTLKKQSYNKRLLQEILKKKIRLIDYEALKDTQNNRLVAFGRYAGIVGAYNGLWTYGKKFKLFNLRRAFECFDVNELKLELRRIKIPPIKIILVGSGRVGIGAMESLDTAGIHKVSPKEFLEHSFPWSVYTQLSSADYHSRKEGGDFNRAEFHEHPNRYNIHFSDFTKVGDILLAGAYWNPKAPQLFSLKEMQAPDFKISVVADITCDINGSIPCTKKPTSIVDPLYDFDPFTEAILPPLEKKEAVTVMAIDNLPCELPRSSSEEFGRDLINKIIKPLVGEKRDAIITRATIAENGNLTPHFQYLQDFVSS